MLTVASGHLRVYKGDSLTGRGREVQLPEVSGHRLHLLVPHPGLLQGNCTGVCKIFGIDGSIIQGDKEMQVVVFAQCQRIVSCFFIMCCSRAASQPLYDHKYHTGLGPEDSFHGSLAPLLDWREVLVVALGEVDHHVLGTLGQLPHTAPRGARVPASQGLHLGLWL